MIKSDHSGIESYGQTTEQGKQYAEYEIKSDHSGIESCFSYSIWVVCFLIKSDHSGIESLLLAPL